MWSSWTSRLELALHGDDLIVAATVFSLQGPTDAKSHFDRVVGSLGSRDRTVRPG